MAGHFFTYLCPFKAHFSATETSLQKELFETAQILLSQDQQAGKNQDQPRSVYDITGYYDGAHRRSGCRIAETDGA